MFYYIQHHGIRGQQWGVKNGPPYPLGGGDYSPSEKKEKYKKRLGFNSEYNKKHFDTTLSKKNTTLSTLSYDKNRTKNSDMFYASHTRLDNHLYNGFFNSPISSIIQNENGKTATSYQYKFRINNRLKNDVKVASEDSGARKFMELYKKDRDFYNFVRDTNRMQNYFVKEKYGFRAYREAKTELDKLQNKSYTPSETEMKKIYRLFNHVIPYAGDKRGAKDVANQRAKFFKELKADGYGAVLDTNDALYGKFKATSPVIVFDMEQVIPKDIQNTNSTSVNVSRLITAGRKILGM